MAKRRNPKKDPSARRRRPPVTVTRRAQFGQEALGQLLSAAPPEVLPLLAVPSIWLWHLAESGAPAAACLDGCLALHYAFAEFGIASDVQAVKVQVCTDDRAGELYDHAPYFNDDGTFNGHAILVLPDAHRLIDPTVKQFDIVPPTARATLPLMAQLPGGTSLGDEPFAVVRHEYSVTYQAFQMPVRYGWRTPRVESLLPAFQEVGANIAAHAFDLLRHPEFRQRTAASPYPRLRELLRALADAESTVTASSYLFADPVNGTLRALADVP